MAKPLGAHSLGSRQPPGAVADQGATLWFTGLSGAGKSTLSQALEEDLRRQGRACYRLDGDILRTGLCRDLGFSPGDRQENVRRVGEVAALMADAGLICLVALISPYAADRDAARRRHQEMCLPFYEIFVDAPLATVIERDTKGLYRKALAGNYPGMTGIDQPYEAPLNPELHLRTVEETLNACLKRLTKLQGI